VRAWTAIKESYWAAYGSSTDCDTGGNGRTVRKHTFDATSRYFKAFLEDSVNLNQARIDQLNARVEAISASLRADAALGPLIEDIIPRGSYAHKTIIKALPNHEFDADVLLQITAQSN
jgi:hypothetical protein